MLALARAGRQYARVTAWWRDDSLACAGQFPIDGRQYGHWVGGLGDRPADDKVVRSGLHSRERSHDTLLISRIAAKRTDAGGDEAKSRAVLRVKMWRFASGTHDAVETGLPGKAGESRDLRLAVLDQPEFTEVGR